MSNNPPPPPPPPKPVGIKLTSEELALITMMRRNSFQEIDIQIQDSVITSIDQTLKYRRKKGGGLVAGVTNRAPMSLKQPLKISTEEISVISKVREKSFQKITINIKNGVESIFQTLKFKKN